VTAEVPFPIITLLAVSVVAPVPPFATGTVGSLAVATVPVDNADALSPVVAPVVNNVPVSCGSVIV
jgi:hypothetical protein